MAKANWAVVNPSSGSGNKTVNVSSSSEHTGRSARSTVLTITAANVEAKTVSVTQQGKPAYVDSQDSATAAKGGQSVTISGKANGQKLTFSLGTGNSTMKVEIDYPEEHFTMIEDNLMEKMKEIGNYNKTLEKVPIPFSFRDNYISAIVGKEKLQNEIIDNIMLQAMTFHSYESLKIAVFTTRDNSKKWEKYKSMPHLWSNGKEMRFFATELRLTRFCPSFVISFSAVFTNFWSSFVFSSLSFAFCLGSNLPRQHPKNCFFSQSLCNFLFPLFVIFPVCIHFYILIYVRT